MISYIINNKSPLFWLIFHVLLGVVSILTPLPLIIWFYLVLGTSIYGLFRSQENSFIPLVFLITYTTSFELLARMSKTSPYIPYELGKYLLFVLLIFGILKGLRRGYIGWMMFFILLPGLFIDEAEQTTFKNIVFDLMGPINVALAIVFFSKQVIEKDDFIWVLRLLLYNLVSALAFTIIKAPNLGSIEFTLGSNFETSGGFGSNQVSTALGLGAFLLFLFWWYRWTFTSYRWLDIIFFSAFIFRGLLTFSRGGMIGGALGILIVLLFGRRPVIEYSSPRPIKAILKIIPVIFLLFLTYKYADRITGGQLSMRYQGETLGTLRGTKAKTFNIFTANRFQIFKDDLKLWYEYPVLGVGVGASRHMRESSKGSLSHIEISRLLSEHGIPGLIYILILFIIAFRVYRKQRFESLGIIIIAMFIIALFTTFHAAMRTYISPLLIGLSLLSIITALEKDLPDEHHYPENASPNNS